MHTFYCLEVAGLGFRVNYITRVTEWLTPVLCSVRVRVRVMWLPESDVVTFYCLEVTGLGFRVNYITRVSDQLLSYALWERLGTYEWCSSCKSDVVTWEWCSQCKSDVVSVRVVQWTKSDVVSVRVMWLTKSDVISLQSIGQELLISAIRKHTNCTW